MASAVTHTDKTLSHFLTQKTYYTYSYFAKLVSFYSLFSLYVLQKWSY